MQKATKSQAQTVYRVPDEQKSVQTHEGGDSLASRASLANPELTAQKDRIAAQVCKLVDFTTKLIFTNFQN